MIKLKPFPKRTYGSLRDLISDLKMILSNRNLIRKATNSGLVSPEFRERLMLVVTQVNNCRYCSRYHSAEAIKVGISADEVKQILKGSIPTTAPPTELEALQYARHWADNNGIPVDAEVNRLRDVYGQETAEIIQILLRMIRIGNLTGNTIDSWLYRLSFGKWGLPISRSLRY